MKQKMNVSGDTDVGRKRSQGSTQLKEDKDLGPYISFEVDFSLYDKPHFEEIYTFYIFILVAKEDVDSNRIVVSLVERGSSNKSLEKILEKEEFNQVFESLKYVR